MCPIAAAAPATQDLAAGQVQMIIDTYGAMRPAVEAGRIRVLAAAAPTRLGILPQVPTTAEGGAPGFISASWQMLVAPRGTPQPLLDRYEAAMRARNRLLADDRPADPAWLAALEEQMAQHGAAVDAARHRLTAALAAVLESSAPADGFPRPAIRLADGDGAQAPKWEATALADALRAGRALDRRAGRTLTGPHRTDLSVIHADQGQAAALCSTGEQKALLLSTIIGHGELIAAARGTRPILLLDEVAAHLDPARRAALFDRLATGGGQVWMTGTEMALFDAVPAGATRIAVQAGSVAEGTGAR